ncbi:hypothetical protein E4O00_11485 [Treponema sp. OMZ 788]|uniref:hypothetical protein n=1 Tax=Treponema sp. OMZ 788 TaxID=2563664 RepID=UPI0020A5C9A0|nr:hypothetical protein [Treponema sp. OMZ 788]UTC64407.1 hypothetical protein E4O00_11485 [Treponema sp. OMZ 788]
MKASCSLSAAHYTHNAVRWILGIKMYFLVILIVLSIFFVIYYKKYKVKQEILITSEIKEEDYQEIQEYISKTYNIDIHEILFTLIKNSNNKNLIRFEVKLENNSQEKNIKFDNKKKNEITFYIAEKEFELQNKYKARFFTYFSSFEREELERIYKNLPEDLNFLKKEINNKNIWIIKKVFYTRVVVFFYSNVQIPNKLEKYRIEMMIKNYIYSSLKEFDFNNKLNVDKINIEFDTKENFDTNYESNWYYYIL